MDAGKFILKKNKAGVLSLVLGIAIIVAALCASMIYLAYFHRLSQIHDTNQLAIYRRIDSGFNYILGNFNNLQQGTTYQIDLFENGKDSISFHLRPWGLFQVAKVYADQGKLSSEKTAIIGSYPGQIAGSAIYLADKSRPLSIGGNTRIIGNAYLPKSGVKQVVLNKIAYSGNRLIYGETSRSKTNLPPLNTAIVDNLLKSVAIAGDLNDLDTRENLSNAFSNGNTKHFKVPQGEVISGKYEGNMVFHANGKVIIIKEAKLEDVIVEAPFVEIEDGFQGNLQIIAQDTIIIGSNVQLNYPSALVILKKEGKGLIKLQSGCQVEGLIVIQGKTGEPHHRFLHFEPGSKLIGVAYADGMVIMKGNIQGHISCSKLLYTTTSSLYENHIFGARIERNLLPNAFVGADLWGDSYARDIVKWLD